MSGPPETPPTDPERPTGSSETDLEEPNLTSATRQTDSRRSGDRRFRDPRVSDPHVSDPRVSDPRVSDLHVSDSRPVEVTPSRADQPQPGRDRRSEGQLQDAETGSSLRRYLHEVIFEADTPAGKVFDVGLLIAIVISVLVVMLESVTEIRDDQRWGPTLWAIEWTLTGMFTLEYLLRLCLVTRPLRYAFSFFGLVDLLAIIPTYLSLLLPHAQSLVVIRAFRLLRIFRVFKLARYLKEATVLWLALNETRAKTTVFLVVVLTVVLIIGAAMYLIEGPQHGFENIPVSVYWAVVTVTTVGYGDISPQTPAGRILATVAMILGYSIIIVPTGIFSAEVLKGRKQVTTRACPHCSFEGHDLDAKFCKYCGYSLEG